MSRFFAFEMLTKMQAAIINLFTGKLNTEEFCVAMHLCEQFQKGEPLPPQLPVRLPSLCMAPNKLSLQPLFCCSLIPPQMRRAAKDAGLIGTPGSGMNSGIGSPASFEVLQQISQQLSHTGPQQYFAKISKYCVFLNQKI